LCGGRGHFIQIPIGPILAIEAALEILPQRARQVLTRHMPLRLLMNIHLVGRR
jgi:hypothetical protein